MRRFQTASILRATLAPFVVVGLAACGGGTGDAGQFFEDLLDAAGLGDGGDDDDGDDGSDGGADGGNGGDGGGPSGGPPLDYIEDAVNTETDGTPARFNGATGRWRSDINGTILGAARVLDEGAESMNLRFDADGTGTFTCGTDALISYNARGSDGSPLLYSTRPEGASCTVVVATYGAVGERIRGWFEATLIEGAGNAIEMVGSFDVPRLEDQ